MKKSVIELEHFLPYRLSVLANLISSTIASTYQARFGLTIPEWRVLAVLTRHPGLAATDVALKTRMDAVAVSRAVNRLLRSGRLRRTVSRADRRRSVLHVSESGAAVYSTIAPAVLGLERQLLAALDTPTRKLLDQVLHTLTQRAETLALSVDHGAAAPDPQATHPRQGRVSPGITGDLRKDSARSRRATGKK